MLIAVLAQFLEGQCLIREHARTRYYVQDNRRDDMVGAPRGNYAGHQSAAALFHAEHDGFVILTKLIMAADESLVRLYRAAGSAKWRVAVNPTHVFADFIAH